MKKIMLFSYILFLFCFILVGCSNNIKSDESDQNKIVKEFYNILPSEMEDNYIICVNRMNLEIEKDSTMLPTFSFNVLSKKPLSKGTVKVQMDCDTSYEVLYNETTKCDEKFARDICLQYNNMNWSKLKKLESDSKQDKYIEYKSKLDLGYESLDKELFPIFYDNKYTVQFDTKTINSKETIKSMKVEINKFSKEIDLGNITLLNYRCDNENFENKSFVFDSLGFGGVNIAGNVGGIITVPTIETTVNKDIVVKDIYLLNESNTISINEVNVDLKSNDVNINQQWNKDVDLNIYKGTKANFNIKIKDTKLTENQNYDVNIYLIFKYEVDGKLYISRIQALCETRFNSQMLYAIYKDNIDFSSYFKVYPMN